MYSYDVDQMIKLVLANMNNYKNTLNVDTNIFTVKHEKFGENNLHRG